MTHRVIGFNFGDNDFYSTWMPLCKVLVDNTHIFKLSKSRIVDLVNLSLYTFYILYQNTFEYHEQEHIKKYLTIEPRNVFIDDEFDKKMELAAGWANAEFFYITNDGDVVCI